jgi:chromosomal replication initiation ATPase DnaA
MAEWVIFIRADRTMLMEFLYRFCRITQPEIGTIVGRIEYSAVSQARRRLQKRLEQDHKLRKRFNASSDQLINLSKIRI